MICSKCGQECADGTKFCTHCGADLTVVEQTSEDVTSEDTKDAALVEGKDNAQKAIGQKDAEPTEVSADSLTSVEPVKPKKSLDFKKLLMLALPVVAVILLIIILANVLKADPYVAYEKNSMVATLAMEDEVCILLDSGKLIKTGQEAGGGVDFSLDRSAAAFTNADGELIVVNGKKVIVTGIEDYRGMIISAKGDTVAYFRDVESGIGTLMLYYVKNGKTKEIAEDVVVGSAVLSPNGKTVAYVTDFEANDDFKGYYSIDGKKPVEVGKEKLVFAIADKAAYIYYADDDRIYSMKRKKDAEKIVSDLGSSATVFMNAKCTEIMVNYDGKAYASVKGDEKKKVSNATMRGPVLPSDAITGEVVVEGYGSIRNIYVNLTGVDTFEEQVFHTSEGIQYLSNKWESSSLAKGADSVLMSKDAKKIIILDSGIIYSLTDFAKGGKRTLISDDAEAVDIMADGSMKYIYYINEDDELYMTKGKKDKKIADDATSGAISADGKTCYFILEEEKLCCSKSGGSKKSIKTSEGCNVIRFGSNVYFGVEDDDFILYLLDGKKAKEIYKAEY